MIQPAQVKLFLSQFKDVVKKSHIYLVPRDKNQQCLADLGMTETVAKKEIMELEYEEYSSGPEPDVTGGDVWIFGRQVNNKMVYIKLKLETIGKSRFAKCLSFHEAAFQMPFPMKGMGE